MLSLFYADDLVLRGESEEDLKVMVGRFEVCRRRGLTVNAGKRKVIVFGGRRGFRVSFTWTGYV